MTEVRKRLRGGAIRPVAGREEILAAARAIGIGQGWHAVTIRAVAQALGYTSPLLYEHFHDKRDLLTQIAIDGQIALAGELVRDLPRNPYEAILVMVERYWRFMLGNTALYRLMNGMDGMPIDRERLGRIARGSFDAARRVIEAWLADGKAESAAGADDLIDQAWAVLHGMAALHLDRLTPFDSAKAQNCIARLLSGARVTARENR